ncbi:uncharacterized protein LY79DRAFT_256274 [Colletotrichum navitas]|uniref:Uncharacterized protein n=1 Tax=Colletotrichum navitas TaxID=681940 RepID=A0AAD8VBA9_9PEZI|nr:uncharacterized protein LY79DRAFT_256274 [Colletotrichum navitas]KAK1598776.1 hypothetical protein LY79DRAFT_256274 [Colletotrichum navitas]
MKPWEHAARCRLALKRIAIARNGDPGARTWDIENIHPQEAEEMTRCQRVIPSCMTGWPALRRVTACLSARLLVLPGGCHLSRSSRGGNLVTTAETPLPTLTVPPSFPRLTHSVSLRMRQASPFAKEYSVREKNAILARRESKTPRGYAPRLLRGRRRQSYYILLA